jgi:ribosomal protein L16 Arg81 hydroxylase
MMAIEQRQNWRELCSAALDAKDPDELLRIVQELNKVLKHEEQVRQDFRNAMKTPMSSGEIRT